MGVVETPLSSPATGKAWKEWLHLRGVICDCPPGEHEVPEDAFNVNRLLELTSPMKSGDDVRDVQEELMARKYSVGGVGADGVYGPDTAQAVQQFQRDKGLRADGIVGPKTTTALGGCGRRERLRLARLLTDEPMMRRRRAGVQDFTAQIVWGDGQTVYARTRKGLQRFSETRVRDDRARKRTALGGSGAGKAGHGVA